MDKNELLERLRAAKDAMDAAEGDLERVLAEIRVAPRAEKVTVTQAVAGAFQKLRAAREELEQLEGIVSVDIENS